MNFRIINRKIKYKTTKIVWGFFFCRNLVYAADKRCSTGFDASNIEHPGTLWLGACESLRPFGGAAGLAQVLEGLAFAICTGCRRKAGS